MCALIKSKIFIFRFYVLYLDSISISFCVVIPLTKTMMLRCQKQKISKLTEMLKNIQKKAIKGKLNLINPFKNGLQ